MAGVRDDGRKCPTAGVQSKWRQAGGRRTAKLTGMVNIAVFAALRWCVGHILRAIAEFKRLCRSRPLDVSCSGWQKRQETAMIWQEVARWAAKAARFGRMVVASTLPCERLHVGAGGNACGSMRLLRCWRGVVAAR